MSSKEFKKTGNAEEDWQNLRQKDGEELAKALRQSVTQQNLYIPEEPQDYESPSRYNTPSEDVLGVVELSHVPGPSGIKKIAPSAPALGMFVLSSHVALKPSDSDSGSCTEDMKEVNEELYEECRSFNYIYRESPSKTNVISDFRQGGIEDISDPESEHHETEISDIPVARKSTNLDESKPRNRQSIIFADNENVPRFEDSHFWDEDLDSPQGKNKSYPMFNRTKGKVGQLVKRFSVHMKRPPMVETKTLKIEPVPILKKKDQAFGSIASQEDFNLSRSDLSEILQCKKDIEQLLESENDLRDLLRNKRKLKELMVELGRAYDFIGSTMNFVHNSVLMQQNLLTGMLEEIHHMTERIAQFEVKHEEPDNSRDKRSCIIQ